MLDLKQSFTKDNLYRAWRWLNSNNQSFYKNFFRDSYAAYSIAIDYNISNLSKRLKDGIYNTTKVSLMLLPKTYCTTRVYTLLSVEDQILYQALINTIAEKYYNKLNKNYYLYTFGNMYAGSKSQFFYKNWSKGYQEFNKSIKKYYDFGFEYLASFDLTACYDTIDHRALGYILESGGLSKEFVQFLQKLLGEWSSNVKIYKGHGIPQGPMSSGLLAEVILSYFDEKYLRSKNKNDVQYLRYVDDIILMGKDERKLVQVLAELDFRCKQIGLFPQAAKIEIKKIMNIEEEINSISLIDEEVKKIKSKNDSKIELKLRNTIKKYKIIDKTKFKIYLGNSKHNSKLSLFLIDVLAKNSQYYENICSYFERYPRKISDKVVNRILIELHRPDVYQIVSARLLESMIEKTSTYSNNELLKFSKNKFKDIRKLIPYYRYVIIKYLIINNAITYDKLNKYILWEEDWWVKKSILKFLNVGTYGEASYISIVNLYLKDINNDIALSGIKEVLENEIDLVEPFNGYNTLLYLTLKHIGIIDRAKKRHSMITQLFNLICETKLEQPNWYKIFGKDHHAAENKMIRACSYVKSDMSAFVNIIDIFNDILMDKMHTIDKRLPGYSLGSPGSVLYNNGTTLQKLYPNSFKYFKYIHDLRLSCDLSHPIIKKTKKYTSPIEYRQIKIIRPLISDMLKEISLIN